MWCVHIYTFSRRLILNYVLCGKKRGHRGVLHSHLLDPLLQVAQALDPCIWNMDGGEPVSLSEWVRGQNMPRHFRVARVTINIDISRAAAYGSPPTHSTWRVYCRGSKGGHTLGAMFHTRHIQETSMYATRYFERMTWCWQEHSAAEGNPSNMNL